MVLSSLVLVQIPLLLSRSLVITSMDIMLAIISLLLKIHAKNISMLVGQCVMTQNVRYTTMSFKLSDCPVPTHLYSGRRVVSLLSILSKTSLKQPLISLGCVFRISNLILGLITVSVSRLGMYKLVTSPIGHQISPFCLHLDVHLRTC